MSNEIDRHSRHSDLIPQEFITLANELDSIHSAREKVSNHEIITWFMLIIGVGSALGGGGSELVSISTGGGVILTLAAIVRKIDLRNAESKRSHRQADIALRMREKGWAYTVQTKEFYKTK
jgi:hypothetical protein